MEEATYMLQVRGLVQGVGFRPYVYTLAGDFGLVGNVENRNDGVVIRLHASRERAVAFREALIREAPPAASIHEVSITKVKREDFSDFRILESSFGSLSS